MKELKFLGSKDNIYWSNFNDISYDTTNDIKMIEGRDRAKQNVVKILASRLGNNLIIPGYGSDLNNYINSNILNGEIQSAIKNTIIYALSYLFEVEESTEDSELLQEINQLKIRQNPKNPKEIFIDLNVVLRNGENILITL